MIEIAHYTADRLHQDVVEDGIALAKNYLEIEEVSLLYNCVQRYRNLEDPVQLIPELLPERLKRVVTALGQLVDGSLRGHYLNLPSGGGMHTDGGVIRRGVSLLIPLTGETVPFYHTFDARYMGVETEDIPNKKKHQAVYDARLEYGVGDVLALRQAYKTDAAQELPPLIHGAYAQGERDLFAIDIHQHQSLL